MRLLVTGASGFLGRHLLPLARRGHEAVGACLRPRPGEDLLAADLGGHEQALALVDQAKPDAILHLAAMTNVDQCEREPEAAWRANVEVTRNLVEAAERHGAWLLALSSDLVFDGTRGWYSEGDEPTAEGVYARSKIEAERLVLAYPRGCLVRPGIIYGWGASGGKPGFCQWVIDCARRGEPARLFNDQLRTPIEVTNLAEALLELAQRGSTGCWHVAGPLRVSRYEFGLAICEVFGLSSTGLESVSQAAAGLAVARGSDCSLSTLKARRQLSIGLLDVSAGLERMRGER